MSAWATRAHADIRSPINWNIKKNRVREKYLKPDGHMFPSHATMFWALVNDEGERELREKEYHDVS